MKKKGLRICQICEKELKLGDLYFILAIEYPYQNMKVHRSCIKNDQRIREILYNKGRSK
jgi:hypothetical protein